MLKPIADEVVYLDEASVTLSMKPKRVWQHPQARLEVIQPNRRFTGQTIFGACGAKFKPLFMIAKSTNQDDFRAFLEMIRAQVGDGPAIKIVLDNASAHEAVSKTNFCAERNIELVFMPAYSPAFNS